HGRARGNGLAHYRTVAGGDSSRFDDTSAADAGGAKEVDHESGVRRPVAVATRLMTSLTVEQAVLRPGVVARSPGFADEWVADAQAALRTGDSVTLLGAAQALVDGGPVVFERPAPDPDLVRRLWLLLPASTRAELWPAEFAPANALGFDLLVTPKAGDDCAGYLSEQQAGDYPEGRYELNLQIAAEAGDQAALDALFARRSGPHTIPLARVLSPVGLV